VRYAVLLLMMLGCGGAARRVPTPVLPTTSATPQHSPPPKALQHYALAVLAWQGGRPEQAQENLDIAIMFDPGAGRLHLLQGHLQLERGDIDAAVASLLTTVKLDPEDAHARLMLARVLELEGDYDAAAHQLEALLQHLRHDRAFADLVQLYLMIGDRERAAQVLDRWAQAPPDHPFWLRRRAALRLELDQAFEAWEDLAQLLAGDFADGPSVDLLMQATQSARRYGSTLDLLERVVQWEPGNEEMVVRLGGLAERAGDHHRAALAWSHLDMLRGGEDPSVKRMLAQAQLSAGRASDALDSLDAAAALEANTPSPDELRVRALFHSGQADAAFDLLDTQDDARASLDILLLRADLLEQAGRLDEARDDLRRALTASPGTWIVAHALAALEARTGGLDAALALLDQHPDPTADDPERQLQRATLQREASQPEDALATAAAALTRWPDHPGLLHARIVWLRADGHAEEALDAARSANQRLPDQPVLVQQLALMELESGAPERASEVLAGALAVYPDHPHLLNDLAYLRTEAGDHGAEVLAMALRAVDQKPASGAFTDTLGWVYWQRGETAQALEHLERAAQLSPEDPVVAQHLAQARNGPTADTP